MDPQTEILKILEDFGIRNAKAAQWMGISPGLFNMKKHGHNYNRFSQEDLYALIAHIKALSEKLP